MSRFEVYVLRVWRNRALSSWQCAARLERLPGGPSWRFRTAEQLLAHLAAELAEWRPVADVPDISCNDAASGAAQQ